MNKKEKLYLVEPALAFKSAFLEMAADFKKSARNYSHHDLARKNFKSFLANLANQHQGRNLTPGHVAMDSFWLVQDGEVMLGESRMRHRLTPALEIEGGHIGYAIRPSARRKGYGTLILKLTLEKAQAFGLTRVMVTCDSDNIASARIIEKNGGLLTGQSISPRSGKAVSKYWIEL